MEITEDLAKPRTIWVGDIESWMDEKYFVDIFGKSATVVKVKIIRDKITNVPLGYAFVEFESHEAATNILHLFAGSTHPRTNKPLRLNWGTHTGNKPLREFSNYPNTTTHIRDSAPKQNTVSISREVSLEIIPN
jgi:RNA recognition motif-containing protein